MLTKDGNLMQFAFLYWLLCPFYCSLHSYSLIPRGEE